MDLGIQGTFYGERFFRIENSELIATRFPDMKYAGNEDDIQFLFGNPVDTLQTNPRPKAIIIMNHPQEESFSFRQPVDHSVIVVQNQEEDGFNFYPGKAKTNLKRIHIQKTDFRSFPYWAKFKVELKWKNDFKGIGFQWIEEEG